MSSRAPKTPKDSSTKSPSFKSPSSKRDSEPSRAGRDAKPAGRDFKGASKPRDFKSKDANGGRDFKPRDFKSKDAKSAGREFKPRTAPPPRGGEGDGKAKRTRVSGEGAAEDKPRRTTEFKRTWNNDGNKRTTPRPDSAAKRVRTSSKFDEKQKKMQDFTKAKVKMEAARDARQELVVKMNKQWNELREKEMDKVKALELARELAKSLKGKLISFASRPDTSRVIQTVFKKGDSPVREQILAELQGQMALMAKGKHSAFLVISLLRCGTPGERSKIASELRDSVKMLGTHANGARVVNFCLSGKATEDEEDGQDVLSATEKKRFYESFYGAELLLLGRSAAEASSSSSYALAEYLPTDPAKKPQAMQQLKKSVLKMAEKGLLRFPFVHVLIWEFCKNASKEDLVDLIPSVSEASLAMISTWEGTMAVAKCVLAGDAKDRKKIIKEWKSHVVDMCAHRFGWYALCRALDSVDDTVFLEKLILEELLEDESKLKGLLCQEEGYGRKAFLRVLAGDETRLKHYFEHYEEYFVSAKLDPISTSKKDPEVRTRELLLKLAKPLFGLVVKDAKELLVSARATDVVRELFVKTLEVDELLGCEERKAAISVLAEVAAELLEDDKAHATIKRMIKDEMGKKSDFSVALVGHLKGKMLDLVKVNRAAFILDALLENPATAAAVKAELKLPLVKKLDQKIKGVEALVKRLSGEAKA